MIKKLRIVLAASLLTSALISNANAFTTDSDAAFNTSRSAWCVIVVGGMYYWYPC